MPASLLSPVGRHKITLLALWLLMSALFILLCWSYSYFGLKQDLQDLLQQQLPAKLQNALYYSDDNGPVTQLIRHNVDTDLYQIGNISTLPLFSQCRARVTNLIADSSQTGLGLLNISWLLGNKTLYTQLAFACQTQWLPAIFYPIGCAGLLLLLCYLLPLPLHHQGQHIRRQLQHYLTFYQAHKQARQLCTCPAVQLQLFEHLMTGCHQKQDVADLLHWLRQPQISDLSKQQLAWFMLASQQYQLDKEQALKVAMTPPSLQFSAEQGQLVIHGLSLTLLKTPYFYYLWYASLRCQHDGWQLNPPVNRSDKSGATVLIDLMQQGGGHSKAINDLLENGLRAKTLDQNRNKLKAELISLLGEDLAQDYLFDTERDLKSGRYRYRLSLPANAISLPPALLQDK